MRTEKIMAKPPPSIPVSMSLDVTIHWASLEELERAKEREVRNLNDRHSELLAARNRVTSLERQVSNVKRSIDDLNERIKARSDAERVAFLEDKVRALESEVSELRNPRGRECH